MTRSLVMRADGGPGVGTGHLARCLALAQAWVDRGGEATLVSSSPAQEWLKRFRDEGVDLRSPDGWEHWLSGESPSWVVLDGYHLGDEQRAVRTIVDRLLVIDDHGATGCAEADVVVDQNLGATREPYVEDGSDTEVVLGPRYALLRRDFRRLHARRVEVPDEARRLLVAVGGRPSPDLSQLVGRALSDPRLERFAVTTLVGVEDVAGAMADADLALSASGTTCWELCCAGVPAVLMPVAPNQEPLAAALAQAGVAASVGPSSTISPDRLVRAVVDLADDADRRREMTSRGRRVVDGRGAPRIVTRMLSRLVELRPAMEGDARLLWEWANDPAVRAASFSSEPIPWDSHVEWFARRIGEPNAHLYIAFADGAPVGQARFEGSGAQAEISVSIAPEARGRGWSAAVVDGAVRRLFSTSGVTTVVARIKPDNGRSQAAFEDADFTLVEEPTGSSPAQLHYVRTKEP